MRRAARARWVWLAAAISWIVAAAFPAATSAAQSPCTPGAGPPLVDPSTAGGVNIHVTADNSVIWCSARVIEANSDIASGTNYPLRSTTQSPNYNPVSNAISIGHLLTVAGVNPATVNHTETMRVNGSWTSLDNADLTDPAATFADGLAPIFFIDGAQTFYLRPLRTPSDTNGDDEISASNGAPLDFYVYSGPLLDVSASANPTSVATNHPVTLTAEVTNDTAVDGPLTYTWTFQDGTNATGQTVTHAYGVAGTWYPVVTVQGSGNDSGGASQPVAVTVGSVPTGPGGPTPGGANPGKHAPPGGSAHGHGNTSNGTPTPTNTGTRTPTGSAGGPVTSSAGGTTSPGGGATSPPGGGATSPARGATLQTSSSRAHGVAPPTRAAIVRHSGVNGGGGRGRTEPNPSPAGTLVDGRLISDVIPISAAKLATEQTAGTGAAAPARLGGSSIPPLAAIGGACAVILLLGAGGVLELRSQRRAVAP